MSAAMKPHTTLSLRRARGFSLVELMIAVALGLVVVAGLTGVFVSHNQARSEIERTHRQIENGRYAIQLLAEDLRHAGYLAEFSPTSLATPATKPDACSTSVANLVAAMPLHVQGYDNGASAPTCLSDVRAGTDIVVIRRVSTCTVGSTDCDAVRAGLPYFQASLCNPVNGTTELASSNISEHYRLGTDTSTMTLRRRDCSTTNLAALRRYRTHIYFIANNNRSGDGIPTLKRAELDASGGTTAFTIVPMVEGIENLQLEHGMDIGPTFNGSPKAYNANPDAYNSCAGAACVANWRNVVAVSINLLARNNERSPGHVDTKTYTLGNASNGSAVTVGPFNDAIKRHVYQTTVKLMNPAGRLEQ